MSEKYPLNFKGQNKDKVYKKSQSDDKSINTVLNRLINHALNSDQIYFEMQLLEVGERFKFTKLKNESESFRLKEINLYTGSFVCHKIGSEKIIQFPFKTHYLHLVYTY